MRIIAWLLLLVSPALSAASELVGVSPGPNPIGDPLEWVLPEDYPAEALEKRLEGTVSFVLHVNAMGAVERCDITGSSGIALLDAATCAPLQRRAKFSVSRDANGKPVAGDYSNKVVWQIPAELIDMREVLQMFDAVGPMSIEVGSPPVVGSTPQKTPPPN